MGPRQHVHTQQNCAPAIPTTRSACAQPLYAGAVKTTLKPVPSFQYSLQEVPTPPTSALNALEGWCMQHNCHQHLHVAQPACTGAAAGTCKPAPVPYSLQKVLTPDISAPGCMRRQVHKQQNCTPPPSTIRMPRLPQAQVLRGCHTPARPFVSLPHSMSGPTDLHPQP